MKSLMVAPVFPLSGWMVAGICALYLLTGAIGHDPWKTDDALHLGVVWSMLRDGNWLIPRIAGETWVDAEPLYHWAATSLAWLLRSLLPEHDAARLATPLFGGAFLWLLFRAGATLGGREAGLVAPLLAIGTLGLLVPIHDAHPSAAMLAATAAAYFGLTRLQQAPRSGGALLGLGCGTAALAGGLGALLPLTALLLVPFLQKRWLAAGMALAVCALLASIWPAMLAQGAPAHLDAWWRNELATAAPHARALSADHLELVAWFTWPLLPLALWAIWIARRDLFSERFLPLTVGTLAAATWYALHEPRPQSALVLIVPLTLFGADAARRLRRGAANALDWFGLMTFTLTMTLIWLGGVAMWTGWPPKIARNFAKLEPGFVPQFSWLALICAAAFTAVWIWALFKLPRSPWRAPARWALGLTALWGVLIALWLPWIDYGKTYRPVALALSRALPKDADCVGRRNLGLPQRALIDYHGGIRTRPEAAAASCHWLLVQGSARSEKAPEGWRKAWEGSRPGDKNERLRLYRRD